MLAAVQEAKQLELLACVCARRAARRPSAARGSTERRDARSARTFMSSDTRYRGTGTRCGGSPFHLTHLMPSVFCRRAGRWRAERQMPRREGARQQGACRHTGQTAFEAYQAVLVGAAGAPVVRGKRR